MAPMMSVGSSSLLGPHPAGLAARSTRYRYRPAPAGRVRFRRSPAPRSAARDLAGGAVAQAAQSAGLRAGDGHRHRFRGELCHQFKGRRLPRPRRWPAASGRIFSRRSQRAGIDRDHRGLLGLDGRKMSAGAHAPSRAWSMSSTRATNFPRVIFESCPASSTLHARSSANHRSSGFSACVKAAPRSTTRFLWGFTKCVMRGRDKRALLVVTDGTGQHSKTGREQVIAAARAMKVLIYTVGIGEEMVDPGENPGGSWCDLIRLKWTCMTLQGVVGRNRCARFQPAPDRRWRAN